MKAAVTIIVAALGGAAAQNITFRTDPGVYGPTLEVVHAYYGQWPTGVAVSSKGRIFTNYPAGLDSNNTYNGSNGVYAVSEAMSLTTERAYPSLEINHPPGGAINRTTDPPTTVNYQDYLIGVQSVVIDAKDRLWILDTGRVSLADGTLLLSSQGGPKLVGVDLTTDKVFQTIVFPSDVAYPDSYLNDVRFDLRSGITKSGAGIAYISDSSSQGRNGIIVADLGTGESWRHLDLAGPVLGESQFLPFIWGQPKYSSSPNGVTAWNPTGVDGIALSADGETLYFGPFASRYLYSMPTSRLRARGINSELLAQQSVVNHGQKGSSDGFETDSNGLIYVGNTELNAVNIFYPKNGSIAPFVRDPRVNWVDTMSVAADGYLYFTANQLLENEKMRPFPLFRAPLPNDGTKVPAPKE
ncbi:major royal jelly protein-domain-containing protein [Xylariaceae sp. FL0255]|nr:major royal jelly protein-domain-containing protein [Xylariaceae sp. FL0255]